MEATIKNELTDIMGYEPSRGEILEILKAVKETGKSIIEVAQDRSFPEMFLVRNGKMEGYSTTEDYDSLEDYRAKHPHRNVVLMNVK